MTTKVSGAGVEYPNGAVQSLPSKLLGMSYAELTTSGTGATTIPWDDTVPQNTEGNQILTVTHNRLSATSYLLVSAITFLGEETNTADAVIAALFQDAIANALVTGMATAQSDVTIFGTYIANGQISLTTRVASGGTGNTTFKLRVGCNGGTVRWNGAGGATRFGGTVKTTITVMEIEA